MPQPTNKRLFVGNLAESVDEYTLIQFLSKHGKISKFDFLFHKAGPKKGRPRGYAFVEYASPEEALKTMLELNDKLLMGRKLSIKRANDAPDHAAGSTLGGGGTAGSWRNSSTAHKPTAFSLLKGHRKPESRDSKINALEAKLQAMEGERAYTPTESASEAEVDREGETNASVLAAPADDDLETTSPAAVVSRPATPAAAAVKVAPAVNLPRKPTADTIVRGQEALEAKESGVRLFAPREPAKTTLASLNASMGK